MSDYLYVAVAGDDRMRPVVAESLEDACERAAAEFNLRHGARDPSNWEEMFDRLTIRVNDERAHWRLKVRAPRWGYASIHRLESGDFPSEL